MSIRLLWIGTTIAATAYTLALFTILPEEIAQHFDLSGRPDDWGSRDANLGFMLALIAVCNLSAFGLSRSLERIPVGVINVPSKAYWLATPERRTAMYARTRTVLGVTAVFGNLLVLMVLGMFHGASAEPPVRWIHAIFPWSVLVGSVVLTVWLVRYLRPPRDLASPKSPSEP